MSHNLWHVWRVRYQIELGYCHFIDVFFKFDWPRANRALIGQNAVPWILRPSSSDWKSYRPHITAWSFRDRNRRFTWDVYLKIGSSGVSNGCWPTTPRPIIVSVVPFEWIFHVRFVSWNGSFIIRLLLGNKKWKWLKRLIIIKIVNLYDVQASQTSRSHEETKIRKNSNTYSL